MAIVASSGSKLSVSSRAAHMEGAAITRGDFYEANYDVSGENMSQRQAIEFIREVRRRSLDYADVVLFQYAEVKQSSPQTITYQFKALKSTRSPFVVTAAVILGGIILAAKAALVLGAIFISLRALDRISTGLTQPFVPSETTVIVDPETGQEYGTYEEYAFAWNQRHPGESVPEPGRVTTTEVNFTTMIIGLSVIVIVGLLIYYLWKRWK